MIKNQDQVKEITNSIKRGIAYLTTKQQKNGSFLSLSSLNLDHFNKATKFHTTFSTALILSCLNNLEKVPGLDTLKKNCASFLLSQKSQDFSFNYWVRGSKEANKMPYPDDLDDTFCTISALFKFNPALIDGAALASIVNLLTVTEEKVGGPYHTWLVPDDADPVWKDVDLVVNCNIAYFLSLQDIVLPNLNKFIASRISQSKITSPYYPAIYPIIYFISRFLKQPDKHLSFLQKMLLIRQKSGIWENPLYTSLAISSLINLDYKLNKLSNSIKYLLKGQQSSGYWDPFAFCLDPGVEGNIYYSGSSALTTAFCLEALNRYLSLYTQKSNEDLKPNEAGLIYQRIITNIKIRLLNLNRQLQTEAYDSLENTLQKENRKQVALLPYYFKLALGAKGDKIPDELIIQLGMANVYGWIAYTIYDDFLDDEGNSQKLSVANLALRELTTIFTDVCPGAKFNKFFQKIIDRLDNANTWEVKYCRTKFSDGKILLKDFKIPDYGDLSKLAERSLGHTLTPIAILYFLGFSEKSKEVKDLLNFFKHYLIARQLNDDAHDFEKDLRMGHVNYVGAILLKRAKIDTDFNFSKLLSKLQEIFWVKVLEEVCDRVIKHTRIARKYLKQCSVISDYNILEKLLEKYEKAVDLAIEERKNTIKFLKKYQNLSTDTPY